MNLQFYLDKPFLPKVNKTLVQKMIKEGKNVNKYLNPLDTSIYAWLSFEGKKYIKVKTSDRIAARWWDFRLKKPRKAMAGSSTLSTRLEELKHHILKNYRSLIAINPYPTLDDIRKVAREAVGGITPNFNRPTFLEYYDKYLDDRRTSIKRLTYVKLKSFRNVFVDYLKHTGIKPDQFFLENLTDEWFSSFKKYLFEERNELNNSASKHFDSLRTFLKFCMQKGALKQFSHNFDNYRINRDQTEVIFLTRYELDQVIDLDLKDNPTLDRVRDCFLFLCFTGQRYSDMKGLRSTDIVRTVDGWEWHLYQEKGNKKKKVIIPLLPHALAILEKYGITYNSQLPQKLPVLSNQKMNEKLKLICRDAKIDQLMTLVKYSGLNKVIIQKPKWKFIGTHTGRKTFITLSLLHMPIQLVQQVSGHSSIRVLQASYQGLSVSHLHSSLKEAWLKDSKSEKR